MLAQRDDDAHAAVRAAYREVDRLNHCIHEGGRRYDSMGYYDESYTVTECDLERWVATVTEAFSHLERIRAGLAGMR